MSGFTRQQYVALLKPVRQDDIENKRGLSYLPQHIARAQLIRIFGPGNVDHTMHEPVLLYETKLVKGDAQFPSAGKAAEYWVTAYRVGCTLRVRNFEGELVYECTEYHVEENAPLPNRGEAHAMAVTSAQSYALRRAALSLGDALGLHLYDKGSADALVKGTYALTGDPDAPLYVAPAAAKSGDTAPENPAVADSATPAPKTRQRAASKAPAPLQAAFNPGDSPAEEPATVKAGVEAVLAAGGKEIVEGPPDLEVPF